WGLGFRIYSDDNRDVVPDEGDPAETIDSRGNAMQTDNYDFAWYNTVPPLIAQQPLINLYGVNGSPANPPLPGSRSIYSCPSAAAPVQGLLWYDNPPDLGKAYFMYGENARICVNFKARGHGVPQVKMINVVKPS